MRIERDKEYITNVFFNQDEVANARIMLGPKKSIKQWAKDLGASIVVNCSLFDFDTGIPIETFRHNGNTTKVSNWVKHGFGICADAQTILFEDYNENYLDYTCGFPTLIWEGVELDTSLYKTVQGVEPRTVFSKGAQGFCITTVDGRRKDKPGMSLSDVSKYLKNQDTWFACNLDGGDSTCVVVNNEIINSPSGDRDVPCVLAIWLKEDHKRMTIGLNIGHYGTVGAVGYLDETTLNELVYAQLKPMLEKQGHTVIPCNDATYKDYVSATKLANQYDLDLLISIHHNSSTNSSATGTCVLYYSSSEVGLDYATRFSEAISKALGLYNLGAKASDGTYIISRTKAPCVLLESLFVSNKNDCSKFNAYKIAKAVASCLGDVEDLKEGVSNEEGILMVEEEIHRMVEGLAKHIQISDQAGLIAELVQQPNSRLYWICKKCLEVLSREN